MVSFVPPALGTVDGAVARTLPSVRLIGWPGLNGPHVPEQTALDLNASFERTSVIVPSPVTLLAPSRLPSVVNNLAGTFVDPPVVPYVNVGVAPSEVVIETNQSSCAPNPAAAGGP